MKSLNDSLDECKKIDAESKWAPSYDKYLQRLATYQLFKWFGKPAEFSPIECARRGWINFSKDTLKCVACSRLFYFSTQSPTKKFSGAINATTAAKPANEAAMLVENHNQNCPWRTLIVPNHLIKVDVVDEDKAYGYFVKLKASLRTCEKLPLLSLETVENFSSLLVDESSDAAAVRLEPRDKLVNIIASCGWNYKEDKNIMSCDKCLRSIGLWLYKRESGNESKFWLSKEAGEVEEDRSNITAVVDSSEQQQRANLKNYPIKKRKLNELVESSGEQQQASGAATTDPTTSKENDSVGMDDAKKKLFDPINEHFSWCPWLDDKPDTLVLNFRSSIKRPRKSAGGGGQSICYANFQIINRHMIKTGGQSSSASKQSGIMRKQLSTTSINSNIKSNDDSVLKLPTIKSAEESKSESQRLIERAKSIKSLLISCTAQAPS